MYVCSFIYLILLSFFLLCIGKQNELNFSWQFELCLRQHEEERPIHSINFTQSQLGAQNYFRLYISACFFLLALNLALALSNRNGILFLANIYT